MSMYVEVNDIAKSFPDPGKSPRTVLGGISLGLKAGAAALIDGPSGSGKSTLLNILSGLLLPDRGTVRIGDTRLESLSEPRRDRFRAAHIGYIFQTFNLLAPLTVLENLTLPARLSGLCDRELAQRATQLLTRFGLGDHLHKPPYQLSVGQRQRVAVARAMMHRPGLILADEPTANLDDRSAGAVIQALCDLKDAGVTLVIASHDPRLRDISFDVRLDLGESEVSR